MLPVGRKQPLEMPVAGTTEYAKNAEWGGKDKIMGDKIIRGARPKEVAKMGAMKGRQNQREAGADMAKRA